MDNRSGLDRRQDFVRRIRFDPVTGCWQWRGKRHSRDGYGMLRWSGKAVYAHRAAYELFVGPLDGAVFRHGPCGDKACVNPFPVHARPPGTIAENNRDRWEDAGACVNGHAHTPESVRVKADGSRYCRFCVNAKQRARYADKIGRSPRTQRRMTP